MKNRIMLIATSSAVILLVTLSFPLSAFAATPGARQESTTSSFSVSTSGGRQSPGKPLSVGNQGNAEPRSSSTGGEGFLAIFQEVSSESLAVSVGGASPTNLGLGEFSYGLVPAGTYSIVAKHGVSTVVSGSVTVSAGQYVTALMYLTVGGTPTVTGFDNNRSALPIGQSRMVLRNTANVGPLDLYVNGVKVANGLVNNPVSPQSVTLNLPAGQITVEAVPSGQPESNILYAQTGVLLAGDLLNIFVVGDSTATPSTLSFLTNANPLGIGYRLYASDGGVFDFGNAGFYGSMGGKPLNKPIVGAAPSSLGRGYWLVASDGGVFTFGDAGFWGSAGNIRLNKPIVGMSPAPDDEGYWLAASDGGIFNYGDARFFGSTGNRILNKPVVGIAATPNGSGYWLVASDGGVFTFGDAQFFGSTGGMILNKPIVAIVPTVDGQGYWLVASDGGVFAFGDASFRGSTGNLQLNKPIVNAISTPDSLGYWLVASDGGIFSFGDANFYGSTGSLRLNQPIVWGSSPGALVPG